MEKRKVTNGYIIFILIVVFFPVGFYYLFRRMDVDAMFASRIKANVLQIAGVVMILLGVSMLIFGLTRADDPAGSFVMCAIFLLIGIVVFAQGKSVVERFDHYLVYLNLICNEGIVDIGEIARITDRSYRTVYLDIQRMIMQNYATNMHVNVAHKQVVLDAIPHASDFAVHEMDSRKARVI